MNEDQAAVAAAQYTRTGRARREAMVDAVKKVDREKIVGAIVECGVWCGGNITIARKLSPDRVCWLYDTFTGMTEPGPEDLSAAGFPAIDRYENKKLAGQSWCAASLDEVKLAFRSTETFDESKLRFVVGDVEQTLRVTENIPDRIAILRLDTDWYASTKIELDVLYPQLALGGVLIVDDYGHWQGARKAVDEYFKGQPVKIEQIDYTAIRLVKLCSM